MTFILRRNPSVDTTRTIDLTQIYLTRRQVAQRYPISEHTLARLASAGRGPVSFKPTDKVLYRPEDIEAWIEAAQVPQVTAAADGAPGHASGRGKASKSVSPPRKAAPSPDSVSSSTRRRLKSLTPSPASWLRREA